MDFPTFNSNSEFNDRWCSNENSMILFKNGLMFATPDLYFNIGPDIDESKLLAINKYIKRVTSRATPNKLWAGIIGNERNVKLDICKDLVNQFLREKKLEDVINYDKVF